jgi:hypothetical protein
MGYKIPEKVLNLTSHIPHPTSAAQNFGLESACG